MRVGLLDDVPGLSSYTGTGATCSRAAHARVVFR
jgi:hypothetical protein